MIFYKETNFKETSIGRIPHEWETVKLGEVISHVKGKKPKVTMEEYREKSLPYLSADYLRNGIPTQFVKITGDEIIVENGDIVLLWDGSNAGEFFLGKIGVLSSTMVRLNLEKNCFDKLFMFYLLKKKECFLKGQTKGTGIPHVDKNVLKNIILPLPPFEEQRAIVDVLGVVDSAVELVDKVIAKTERLKKGLMQTLLTRGIGHKEYKQTPIGTIPKTWKVLRLEAITVKVKRGPSKKTNVEGRGVIYLTSDYIDDEGFLIFENLKFLSETEIDDVNKYLLNQGDLLVNCVNSLEKIGKVSVFEGYENQKVMVGFNNFALTLKENFVYPHYLKYYFLSAKGKAYLKSISKAAVQQVSFSSKDLLRIKIPIPPLPEQIKIAQILLTVDRKLQIERKNKERLKRIKQGLMDLLLTGKIRVKVD